jgi:hypothetical protein
VNNILELGSKWDELELHENPNEFVYEVGEKIALVWGYLCLSGKLPFTVRKTVWENMVLGAYLSLLEGFARVPSCSTEGRSLMMLDLAALATELAPSGVAEKLEGKSITVPSPPASHSDGMFRLDYVDTYIKMVYFPKDDAVVWIDQNFASYQLNHMLSLVKVISGENDDQHLIDHVKSLYAKAECHIFDLANQ